MCGFCLLVKLQRWRVCVCSLRNRLVFFSIWLGYGVYSLDLFQLYICSGNSCTEQTSLYCVCLVPYDALFFLPITLAAHQPAQAQRYEDATHCWTSWPALVQTGKSPKGLSWKICPREVPSVISSPEGKSDYPRDLPRANVSDNPWGLITVFKLWASKTEEDAAQSCPIGFSGETVG